MNKIILEIRPEFSLWIEFEPRHEAFRAIFFPLLRAGVQDLSDLLPSVIDDDSS